MSASVLHLPQVPEWVWDEFHTAPAHLRAPAALAPVVARWQRARALGAPSDGRELDDLLLRGSELREREERAGLLVALAERIFLETDALLARHGYVLLLADADGVVVSSGGGGEFGAHARRVNLIEGACWSEAARGTNAIGTALVEAAPTVVQGSAHYGRRFHELVCYAAPVRGPDGAVVGVLDATSSVQRTDDALALAVTGAAASIEATLRLDAYARVGASVLRTLGRSLERSSSPVLLVEPSGLITRMNAAARVLLASKRPGLHVQEAIGLSFAALQHEARSPTPGGRALALGAKREIDCRLTVDPVETMEGKLIAVVVHLTPVGVAGVGLGRPALGPRVTAPVDDPFAPIFAEDAEVRASVAWARRVAASPVPVILLAETGSGKELFAEAIHRASGRAGGPFVAVNCGSIAPSLLESELFGYAPGAFTGAQNGGREGYLQAADGGTLFLDEVAEMPPTMQVALLRVLEDGQYRRVGDTQLARADVRVVCATCRDLPVMVAKGEFRSDLYYRLRGATVRLPPLRSRTDRAALARHLLRQVAERRGLDRAPALSPEVERWIMAEPWPGNIRELRSVLEVALVLAADAAVLELAHLPPHLGEAPPPPPPGEARLADAEARALREALEASGGNVSAAAARLGVARSTVYRMMRKHL